MNMDTFMQNPTGQSSITIQNLMGLFIEGTQGSGANLVVVARIVPAPGFLAGCPPGVSSCTVTGPSAFLSTVLLVS
jgi:hypothetical protein